MAKKDKVTGAAVPAGEAQTPAAAETPKEASAVIGVRGPKGVPETAVITLLTATNPKREGSKAHERFAKYVDGQTVKQALDAGVLTADLVYDATHGFIKIAGYDVTVITPKPKAEPKAKKEAAPKDPAVAAAASELAATTQEETVD